eukprot:226162_1
MSTTEALESLINIISNTSEIARIDILLGTYYASFGINNYFNHLNQGLFIRYVIDNNLQNEDIEKHLSDSNCKYIHFDAKFPIGAAYPIDNLPAPTRARVVFFVLQYIYKYNSIPSHEVIIKSEFERIDKLMYSYYVSNYVRDYYNENNVGRFIQFTIDNQLMDYNIYNKLGHDSIPSDCIYTQFDFQRFPISRYVVHDKTDKKAIIFYILQCCCYKNSIKGIMQPRDTDFETFMEKIQTERMLNAKTNRRCVCDRMMMKVEDSSMLYKKRGGIHIGGYDVCENCINNCKSDEEKLNEYSLVDMSWMEYSICSKTLRNCVHLEKFIEIMNKYDITMDRDTSLELINIYLHLLQIHNSDEDFEYIFNSMSECNVPQCDILLKRQYRDPEDCKIECNASHEMLDKIHCYFMH